MPLPSIIAIDGPASSGKSSISFAVARRLGYLYVDTGAFYRAITFLTLEQKLDITHVAQIIALAQKVHLDITPDQGINDRQYTVLADGRDITADIHSPEVDAHVSQVSAIPGVRAALLDVQRRIASRGQVIMAGRDIGTVVLPHANLKIYIDADLDHRAERRYHQRLANGEPADLDKIREGLKQRDHIDSSREVSPLLRAPDAVYLDTSTMTLDEAIEAAYQLLLHWEPTQQG